MIGRIIPAAFRFHFMTLAVDVIDWRGPGNETLLPVTSLVLLDRFFDIFCHPNIKFGELYVAKHLKGDWLTVNCELCTVVMANVLKCEACLEAKFKYAIM